MVSSCAMFQNDSSVRHTVASKNIKRTFVSSEPLRDDFTKILLYGNQVINSTLHRVEFYGRGPNSLGRVES